MYLILICMIFLFSACTQKKEPSTDETMLQVYASIYPMYDFTKQIGKEKVNVTQMIPPGVEPHDWEPTAKMMAEIENADILIYNGIDLEMWIDQVIGSLQNNIITAEASEGLDWLLFEGENHEESLAEDHDEEHHHGKYDPHIWLDPLRAMEQCKNIKNALVQADPKNKTYYEKNYEAFAEKLENLNQKYQEILSSKKSKDIVVSHAAFGYLADRYGLKQIAVSGLSPQEEPSPAKLTQVTDLIHEHHISTIFYETLTSPKISSVLAEETGAKTAVLNPIEGLTQSEIESGKDYIQVMEDNLVQLDKALQ